METHFTFRHMDSSEAVRERVLGKLERLHKILGYPVEFHVVLEARKNEQFAEITCHAEHQNLAASAVSENLYESIDEACDKLEVQLKKERDRKKGHQKAVNLAKHPASAPDVVTPHQGKRSNYGNG